MDKRDGLWIGLGLMAVILSATTPLLNDIVMLLVLGTIPGTDILVPMWVVYTFYPLIAVSLLAWLATHTLYIGEPKNNPVVKPVISTRRSRAKKVVKKAVAAKPSKRRTRVAV